MASLNDFPELKALHDSLREQEATIRAQSAPLWEQYNTLRAQYDPIWNAMREASEQIKKIEQPHLGEICNKLSMISRAIGGARTSDNAA